jgi:hypothetical protein
MGSARADYDRYPGRLDRASVQVLPLPLRGPRIWALSAVPPAGLPIALALTGRDVPVRPPGPLFKRTYAGATPGDRVIGDGRDP